MNKHPVMIGFLVGIFVTSFFAAFLGTMMNLRLEKAVVAEDVKVEVP